jgi:RNA polymerase sigma-70 factor, ECF subfamily
MFLVRYSSASSEDLVRACAGSTNQAAWEEFIRRFHRLIAAVVLRTARRWGDPSPQQLADLVQDTYLKLCEDDGRLLRSFHPHHPDAIYGFLKVVATNVVHDHYKAASAEKRGKGQSDKPLEQAQATVHSRGPDSFESMERRILLLQIEEALTAIAAGQEQQRNRLIFWLYYRHGMSASAIASMPSIGLTTKGVESTILRMTRMIRSHMLERTGSALPTDGEGLGKAKSL